MGHRLRENSVVGQLQTRLTQDFSSRVVGPLRLRSHVSRYPLLIIFFYRKGPIQVLNVVADNGNFSLRTTWSWTAACKVSREQFRPITIEESHLAVDREMNIQNIVYLNYFVFFPRFASSIRQEIPLVVYLDPLIVLFRWPLTLRYNPQGEQTVWKKICINGLRFHLFSPGRIAITLWQNPRH